MNIDLLIFVLKVGDFLMLCIICDEYCVLVVMFKFILMLLEMYCW